MVYESIDHGNDVTCHEVPVVLFLVFRKKINVIVKNKLTTISMVYTLIQIFFFQSCYRNCICPKLDIGEHSTSC